MMKLHLFKARSMVRRFTFHVSMKNNITIIVFLLFQDWTDYDEKIKESVGIYEVTHQFIKR